METHTMTTGAKQRTKCVNCLKRLNEDDAVWANKDGQIVDGVSDYAWCVECLPEEKNAMTTGDKGAKLWLYDYLVQIGVEDERLEQISGVLDALKNILADDEVRDGDLPKELVDIAKATIDKAEGRTA